MHCTGCLVRILTGYHVSIPSEVVVISNFHFMLRLRRLRTQVRPEIASEQTVGAGRLGRVATTQYLHPSTAWIVKSEVYTVYTTHYTDTPPITHHHEARLELFKSVSVLTGCFHQSI